MVATIILCMLVGPTRVPVDRNGYLEWPVTPRASAQIEEIKSHPRSGDRIAKGLEWTKSPECDFGTLLYVRRMAFDAGKIREFVMALDQAPPPVRTSNHRLLVNALMRGESIYRDLKLYGKTQTLDWKETHDLIAAAAAAWKPARNDPAYLVVALSVGNPLAEGTRNHLVDLLRRRPATGTRLAFVSMLCGGSHMAVWPEASTVDANLALEQATLAVKERPDWADAWFFKGVAEIAAKRRADANRSLQRALATSTERPMLKQHARDLLASKKSVLWFY